MNINRFCGRFVLAALTAFTLPGAAGAQTNNCNPQSISPYGKDFRDFSRNISGNVGFDSTSYTYFAKCTNNGEVTRFTRRQKFVMDLSSMTDCDEMPQTVGRLEGYISTEVRMTDPYTFNKVPNTRIGWHTGYGTIYDLNNKAIGTAKFEGTIGTNTTRLPLPILVAGVPQPECFSCEHFTGRMDITLPNNIATAYFPPTVINAFYQFDSLRPTGTDCDKLDWCDVSFQFRGTLDGISRRACSSVQPG